MKIIFAQGNPGEQYSKSRHNIGFTVLDKLADDLGAPWKEKTKLRAQVAEATLNGEKIALVKPTTYYNETGASARAVVDFYKIDSSSDLLVIHDDLALPLGTIRVRQQGSDAGNNGIKSLNSHLGPNYSRIRIGVWNELRDVMDDAGFVLAKFSKDESDRLAADIIPQVLQIVEQFVDEMLEYTSHKL